MLLLVSCFLAVSLVNFGASATCPHVGIQQRWSSWTGKPTASGATVEISEPILLDESADVFSITITSSGQLVWDPEAGPIELRASYIWVEGRLDIGSEDCPYEGETTITLTGNRGDYDLKAGPKVLLVSGGGTLELHGRKKLSWTKLSKTAQKLENSGQLLYDHLSDERNYYDNETLGFVAYSISPGAEDTYTIKDFGVYNLYKRNDNNHIKNTERLVKQIDDLEDGDVFMMATQYYAPKVDFYTPTDAYEAFETLVYGNVTGESLFRTLDRPDTYAAIIQKGYPESFREVKGVVKDSVVFLDAEGSNLSFKVHCFGDKRDYRQYENFQIMTRLGRYPILDVIDDVTTWRPGDKVVLASTDYDWKQAEERTVTECLECNNKQLKLDSMLTYMHWGEMIEDRVDERGEVALLTRNIVIRGEMLSSCPEKNENCKEYDYDTFGGHVKVMPGFAAAHIEGVELYNVGQQTDLGRYPIHFHMCLNTSDSAPYIRDNSIHHTFARCVTIHGTHHVEVDDNVCYRSHGHSYFLEDGSEMYNSFDGNIAIGTMSASLIPTDVKDPTSFWLTNPLTYVRNNVAAGGDGTGFWYIFPIEPLGPSKDLSLLEPWEASKTRLLDCDNNVAHSNDETGFIMEEHLDANGVIQQTNEYQPLEDPRDPNSAKLTIHIDRVTAYKNRRRNIWLEGGYMSLTRSSSADSVTGISLFNTRHRDKHQTCTESVIVGESANIGEPIVWNGVSYAKSFPYIKFPDYPRRGYAYYKGPHFLKDIYFAGFDNNPYYNTGAISWQLANVYYTAVYSSFRDVFFNFDDSAQAGNRVFQITDGDSRYVGRDGDKTASVYDWENNQIIVRPDPFTVTEGCIYRPNWQMATCAHKYGKVRVQAIMLDRTQTTTSIMVRDDLPSAGIEFDFKGFAGYPVALGGDYTYTLAWTKRIPDIVSITADGIEKDAWVRVGMCIPRDAEFKIQQWGGIHRAVKPEDWTNVDSLEELDKEDENTGLKLYHDTENGIIYFVLHTNLVRAANETKDCPNGLCPVVKFTFLGGTAEDADCRNRVFSAEDFNKEHEAIPEDNKVIPANADRAPETWGAGPTRPFLNRLPVNGGYSDWTDWTTCSATCGGGRQARERLCNNPPVANGGQDCQGDRIQTQGCNDDPCPIGGVFSSWSEWSDCQETSLCAGKKIRTRSCTGPFNGGAYCDGYTEEVAGCQAC